MTTAALDGVTCEPAGGEGVNLEDGCAHETSRLAGSASFIQFEEFVPSFWLRSI